MEASLVELERVAGGSHQQYTVGVRLVSEPGGSVDFEVLKSEKSPAAGHDPVNLEVLKSEKSPAE